MPRLSKDEVDKYWEIFQSQQPTNGVLYSDKMLPLLKNSQLDDSKLERIWDIADIDGDGGMDFDEFCIAMRLVFDLIQSKIAAVPSSVPEWLVPAGKRHLVDAKQALSGGNPGSGSSIGQPIRSLSRDDDDDDDMRLSSDFNWYISPSDRNTYMSVYSANSDPLGKISYNSLTELYASLDVPDTDISSAWNLVNPRSDERIDKEQALVFLHILNNRSKGVRVPRSVPASLRATFSKQEPSYDLNSSQAEVRRPSAGSDSSSRGSDSKSQFAEGYLSRLGLAGRSKYTNSGTDFSSTKDTDWEEVRLKRELADLEQLIAKIELQKKQRQEGSNTSVIRRELQLLLEYKEQQLKDVAKSSSGGSDAALDQSQQEIDLIAEQVDALKDHLRSRRVQLDQLQSEIAAL